MKVYVLVGWINYEGDDVLGVFSTEELANAQIEADRKFRKQMTYIPYDRYRVEDYEVDAK